jgi:hypothetical protein
VDRLNISPGRLDLCVFNNLKDLKSLKMKQNMFAYEYLADQASKGNLNPNFLELVVDI